MRACQALTSLQPPTHHTLIPVVNVEETPIQTITKDSLLAWLAEHTVHVSVKFKLYNRQKTQ